MTHYDDRFYRRLEKSAPYAARCVVPLVLELVEAKSVVDLGCGTGHWLREFETRGLEIQGVDSEQVPPDLLVIPREKFLVRNLARGLDLGRRFDLAISLEVAEHLPESSADAFVATLVELAPAILFSAAIPWQTGRGHVNLQWPSYWAGKFAAHGYLPVDAIRHRIWRDERIPTWYRQNTLLYVHRDRVEECARLREESLRTCPDQLDIVHPQAYAAKAWPSLKRTWKLFRARLRASFGG